MIDVDLFTRLTDPLVLVLEVLLLLNITATLVCYHSWGVSQRLAEESMEGWKLAEKGWQESNRRLVELEQQNEDLFRRHENALKSWRAANEGWRGALEELKRLEAQHEEPVEASQ